MSTSYVSSVHMGTIALQLKEDERLFEFLSFSLDNMTQRGYVVEDTSGKPVR
jgi:hypothetical protein